MLEYSARITSTTTPPTTQELVADPAFATAVEQKVTASDSWSNLTSQVQSKADTATVTVYSDYAIEAVQMTQAQLCDLKVANMTSGGVVEVLRKWSCPVLPHYEPGSISTRPIITKPVYTTERIPLTLLSTHNALKAEVAELKKQVQGLSTVVANVTRQLESLKKLATIKPDLSQGGKTTLYPQYGDWLLTSDTKDQYISFSGLRAEVGRSIYIQTRRRAYLYANGHSFYGLPGSSTSVNQWLSHNTTYRFVRASSDSWLVTSSPSPYPWT